MFKKQQVFQKQFFSFAALVSIIVLISLSSSITAARAGQLIYTPVNPTFGGNPFNGDWLLNQGILQDKGPNAGFGTGGDRTDVDTNVDTNIEDLLGDIDTVIGIDNQNNN